MRYVTKPKAWGRWNDEPVMPTSITVHEDDPYEETGLLDVHGNRLYRVRETVPMGIKAGQD